jgi:hypothetical protein
MTIKGRPSVSLMVKVTLLFICGCLCNSRAQESGGTNSPVPLLSAPCTFTLDPVSQGHPYTSEFFVFNVYSPDGCDWTVVNTNDWMIIKLTTNGTGNGIVRYTVFDNPSITPRDAYLSVQGLPFHVLQAGAPCSYSITPTNRLSGTGADEVTVNVFTLDGCPWNVVNTNSWITLNTPATGIGNSMVKFTVAPTLSAKERTGVLLIAGRPFTVTQLGTPCKYTVASTSKAVPFQGSTNTVSVSTSSGCAWRVFSTNDWISLGSPASMVGNGTVKYLVAKNPTTFIRVGILMVAEQPFIITQAPAPCSYTLTPGGASYTYEGGAGSFTLTSPIGCAWSINNTNPWINVLSDASGTNGGILLYRVSTNTGNARVGSLVLNGAIFTVNQTGPNPPGIAGPPASVQGIAGMSVAFTVGVTGSPPFFYQWLLNGTNLQDNATISGSGSPTLTIDNVQPTDAGKYAVVVNNLRGSITSSPPAVLSINTTPLVARISDRTISRGGTLALQAKASDVDFPAQSLTYSLGGGAPAGATLNPTNGLFTWTPSASLAPVTNQITILATDNGTPPLTGLQTFAVSVVAGIATNVTLIPSNSIWKYRDTGENLGATWLAPAYNDTLWKSGQAKLGYGDGDETTVVSYGPNASAKYITTYFRRSFTVTDPAAFNSLLIKLLRDDGAVVYINGVEVFRSNMPNGPVTYTTLASVSVGSTDEYKFFPSPPIDPALLVPGDNTIAVEIHQYNNSNADLEFNLELSAGMSVISPVLFAQPKPLSVVKGGKATFSVTAAGLQPLQFQWYSDAGPLAGATNSSLVLSNVQFSSAGNFYVVVTNPAGSIESDSASMVVGDAPNTAPILLTIGNKTVAEGSLLGFTVAAVDNDTPAQQLTFSLGAGAPAGAFIQPASGLFTWIPTEAQGPGTYQVAFRVTDNGLPALSATQTVTITVQETNSPPVVNPVAPRGVVRGGNISFALSAIDPDFPAQTLTFSLAAGSQAGSSINPSNGLFTWAVPTNAPLGTNLFTVRVADNGSPVMSSSTTVALVVRPAASISNVTLVATGSVWKYLDTGVDPGAAWRELAFNDSTWKSGKAILGYGNGNEGTVVSFGPNAASTYITTWFRRTFNITQPSSVNSMQMRFLRDDGGVIYVNGVEMRRDNMPAGPITPTTLANVKVGSIDENTYFAGPAFTPTNLVAGQNVIAVEIHQNTASSPDVSFDLELSAVVVEVTNQPPVLSPINDQTITVGSPISFDVSASDPDLPEQTLIYSLEAGAPAGASLHPQTGRFRWTPGWMWPIGTNVVSVRVTDSGSPPASDIKTFRLVVNPFDGIAFAGAKTNGSFGTQVTVPILTSGFSDINVFQYSLHWDPTVARFAGVEQQALAGISFGLTLTNSGTLTVSWDDITGQSQTLADGSTLFAINFDLVGAVGTSSQLTMDGNPTLVEAAREDLTVVPVGFGEGSIGIVNNTAPSGLPTQPAIHVVANQDGAVTLWWNSQPERIYRVQYADNIDQEDWIDLEYDVMATGTTSTTTVPATASEQRFYRVMMLGQ